MKRTALRCAAFPLIRACLVFAACIGVSVLPAHAAGPTTDSNSGTPSTYTLELINNTRSRIDSFSIAPAGTDHWTNVDFRGPMQQSSFDYQLAVTLQIHDNNGCLRDLRTVLSSGLRIYTRHFDLCHIHAYRPGVHIFRVDN
jgi:hypothetical protein